MDVQSIASSIQPAKVAADHLPISETGAPRNVAATTQVGATSQPGSKPSLEQVNQAVKSINESMGTQSRGLEFSVDSDSHRTIVKVVDQQTRELIRQMPSEETLQIAKMLDQTQGLLIKHKA